MKKGLLEPLIYKLCKGWCYLFGHKKGTSWQCNRCQEFKE